MNKEQAAQYLAQILANIPATMQQHQQMQSALNVLLKKDEPVDKKPLKEVK